MRAIWTLGMCFWFDILMTLYFGDTDSVDNELCWQKMHLEDTSNYAVNLKFHYCAWQTRQILIISRAAIRWSFVHQSTANTFQISKQFNQSFLRPFWNFSKRFFEVFYSMIRVTHASIKILKKPLNFLAESSFCPYN